MSMHRGSSAWKGAVMSAFSFLLVCFAIINVIAFLFYGRDKSLAKRHQWRTPEKVLLCLGFFGGALGTLAGMQVFRHKTKHWYFWVVNVIGLLWQGGLVIYLMR